MDTKTKPMNDNAVTHDMAESAAVMAHNVGKVVYTQLLAQLAAMDDMALGKTLVGYFELHRDMDPLLAAIVNHAGARLSRACGGSIDKEEVTLHLIALGVNMGPEVDAMRAEALKAAGGEEADRS